MNIKPRTNSVTAKSSKGFSLSNNQLQTKSSVGLKDDNTVDSTVLNNSLQEFYKSSKEKLSYFKTEIAVIEAENEKLKEDNIQYSLKSIQLKNETEELGLRIKGNKEKFVSAQKRKTDLQFSIKDLKKDVESTSRKIETMKIDNNYKVMMIQNDIDHITNLKENNVKSMRKKIENEQNHQQELKEKIREIKEEISKYKGLFVDLEEQDSLRIKSIHKETAEMTKFLSQL